MTIPAAALAAYRAAAQVTTPAASSAITPANIPGGNFSDFLSGAVKDSISTIRQGEKAAQAQVTGGANIVDVVNSVNAAEQDQGVDFGIQTIEEIAPETRRLFLVEHVALHEIVLRSVEDVYSHDDNRSEIRRFADSQSPKVALPSRTNFARSSSMSLCHCGTGITASPCR